MPQEFEIKCVISEEGVPGGLKIDATPKSYAKYKALFEATRSSRKSSILRTSRAASNSALYLA